MAQEIRKPMTGGAPVRYRERAATRSRGCCARIEGNRLASSADRSRGDLRIGGRQTAR